MHWPVGGRLQAADERGVRGVVLRQVFLDKNHPPSQVQIIIRAMYSADRDRRTAAAAAAVCAGGNRLPHHTGTPIYFADTHGHTRKQRTTERNGNSGVNDSDVGDDEGGRLGGDRRRHTSSVSLYLYKYVYTTRTMNNLHNAL